MPRSANATGESCGCGNVMGPSEARGRGDEAPWDPERALDLGAQCAYSEGFGGVVSDVQHGDPELLRLDSGVMGPLSDDERVDVRGFRFAQRLTRRAGAGADGPAGRPSLGSDTHCHELPAFSA